MKRESFGSRLGFILVSAGCAIGIGNVWKFPYICGAYGGAAFILIYLCFLVILGIPVLVAEFAVGRGSHTSVAKCFDKLAPAGSCWKPLKFIGIIGCYMLMMFYTTVGGWMIYYCVKSLRGDFVGATPEAVTQSFSDMLGNAPTMMLWMVIICLIGFAVCFMGLQNGIEKISKVMMSALLIIMVILAVHSVMMEGAGEGIRFYLIPDFQKIKEAGVGNVVYACTISPKLLGLTVSSPNLSGVYAFKEPSSANDHSDNPASKAILTAKSGSLSKYSPLSIASFLF